MTGLTPETIEATQAGDELTLTDSWGDIETVLLEPGATEGTSTFELPAEACNGVSTGIISQDTGRMTLLCEVEGSGACLFVYERG